MTMVDRTVMPDIVLPKKLTLPQYEKLTFANGMTVYVVSSGVHEVCNVEWVFDAGRWFEPQKHVARFTNRMMREGSSKFTSKELSEKMDFLGASFKNSSTVDHGNFSVLTLNKHLPAVLELIEDLLKCPTFPQQELEISIRNNKEKLRVDLQKNEFIADQKMNLLLYGENHPYGYEAEEKNYDLVNIDLLKTHFQKTYNASNCFLFVSGKITDGIIKQLEKYFGGSDWNGEINPAPELPFEPFAEKKLTERKKDALQSAIRICGQSIGKSHPDYQKLSMLNTVFGGYFGSRLMSNIREDKGYTYGIYSGITNTLRSSYFHVSTEVGVEVSDNAVKEIIFEMNRLKKELIDKEELDLVRNYLTGKLLGNFDSPFSAAAMYKNLFIYGLDVDYLHSLMDTIHSVTPEDLREMANKYFNVDDMYQIVIG
jgi:predicted Zn-dependent peptidase